MSKLSKTFLKCCFKRSCFFSLLCFQIEQYVQYTKLGDFTDVSNSILYIYCKLYILVAVSGKRRDKTNIVAWQGLKLDTGNAQL